MTLKRIGAGDRMTSAIVHGDKVYMSGFVAGKAAGGSVAAQTADILAQIDAMLAQAGSDKTKVIRATIWLTDMDTWAEMNTVWDDWVVAGETPCRAAVHSPKLAAPGLDVEIQVEAAI